MLKLAANPTLWSCCGYCQSPHGKRVFPWPNVRLGLLVLEADAGGSNLMSGHTDAVPRTTRHQDCSQATSGVGVAPRINEPGFLALTDAMYRRTYLELGALLTAPACARLHTKQLLWEWGLARLTDTSEAVVSELVTNAPETTIRHDFACPIRLRMSSNGHQVLIEVWDADPTAPRARRLAPTT